jgi:hypothetical protein
LQHGEETKDYKNNQSKTIQPEKTWAKGPKRAKTAKVQH